MKKYMVNILELLLTHLSWGKKWRHLVTAMAMAVVFITTYALILPAITLEKEEGKPEQGVYLDEMERGSTASLNQSPSEADPGQDVDGQDALMTGKESDGLSHSSTGSNEDIDDLAFSGVNDDGTRAGSKNTVSSGQTADDQSRISGNSQTGYANGIYTGKGDGFTVSMDLKEEMRLPADVTISVTEIKEDDNTETAAAYRSYMTAARRAAAREGRGEITSVRFIKFALYSNGKEVRTNQDIEVLILPMEKDKVRNGDEADVLTFWGSAADMAEDLITQMSGYRVSAFRFFYPSIVDNSNWGLLGLAVTEPRTEDQEELQDGDSAETTEDDGLSEEMAASTEDLSSTEAVVTEETATEEKTAAEDTTEETAAEENSTEETVAEENSTEENADEDAAAEGNAVEEASTEENAAEDAAEKTTEEDRKPAEKLEYQGGDYKVVMICDEKAGIPEGAVLQVTEIRKDSEDYDKYLQEASETLEMNKMANPTARFFDIKIMDGEKEIEPDAPVSVEITYDKPMEVKEGEKVDALHFGEKKTEVIEDIKLDTETDQSQDSKNNTKDEQSLDVKGVSFETDSFSVYGVLTYTVEFTFDGYSYSMEGNSSIRLSKLVELLKIAGQDKDYETGMAFVKDVAEASFTDESLVKVEKAGLFGTGVFSWGDWELISLKPFDTEEVLTIAMKDGIKYEIKVTDDQVKTCIKTAGGDRYEIKVIYDETAQIPESAELQVKEILPEDEEYKALQQKAGEKLTDEINSMIPAHPVLLDISFVDGDTVIEPAEGSTVSVEMKLMKDSVTGLYSDENSPILINNKPFKDDEQEISQTLKVIHDVNDAKLDIVPLQEDADEEHVIGQFSTESFSNWLIYLDEELEEITINQGDSITLRPYSEWIWDQKETVDGQTVRWKTITVNNQQTINTNGIMNVTPNYGYHDDQLDQTYDSYTLTTNGTTGTFNLERENGEIIKVTVTGNPASDKPPVIPFENTVQGLTVNMFNYDADGSLDVRYNVASYIDSNNGRWTTFSGETGWNQTTYYQQGPYAADGVNGGSALKFLGWGASNGSNRINNYDATNATTGIVQSTLITGTDGKKYPRLNGNGNTSLQYLFSTGNSDVTPLYNVPGLFQQDNDGYYYFNSNSNYAYIENNQFKLYEHTYSQKTGNGITSKPIGFFPYHDFDSEHNLSPNHDHVLDHHFGMSMEVKFVLPEGKVLHKTGGATDPITFEFSGDDDMWVFVTDNETNTDMLALDVGGIHQPITGSINFTNDSRFVAGKEYTLRIFYLERGGCDSNCSIRFNLPLTKRPFTFEKQDAQDKTKFLKDAKFGLFKDAECKIPAVDDMNGNVYTATADDNGVVSFYASIGNYYMKELEAPAGYRLDETVRRVVLTENGVTIQGDEDSGRDGVQITNRKNPELTVEKEWQNQGGTVITAPDGASAKFELKRYVQYEGDRVVPNTSQPCTFRVYRSRSGQTPRQEGSDYTFKGGTQVSVDWGYDSGYLEYSSSRKRHYGESSSSDQSQEKPANGPAVIDLPESGTAAIYIHDEDLNTGYDPGVLNITVDGTPYTSGDTIEHVSADWAEDEDFDGPELSLPADCIDDAHPWKGKFSNLVVTEIKDGVTYHYKYYIVEKDKTPTASTVVYVDGSGAVISDPAALRTDEDGSQKVINKVQNGGLKLRKWVTIGGVSPDDEPNLKTKADGEYTFTVEGIADTPTAGISKTVKIKIESGKATRAWIDGTETSFDNANDLFVEIPDLIPGDYTITEGLPSTIQDVWLSSVFGGKDDGDTETRKITVTVTSGKSGNDIDHTGKATFTNNFIPDSEEDIAHISIKKTFEGLPEGASLDDDFKITIEVAGKTYELTSNPTDSAVTFDGAHFPVCHWTVSVKGLLKDAPVTVTEVNAGYPAYDVTTSVNGAENTTTYTGTVSSSTIIQAFNPVIYEANNKKDFNVTDTKIFMARLTDGHVLVISKNRLSLSERAAVEKLLAGTGEQTMGEANWGQKLPPYYYVADENRPVHFKGSTITYNNNTVHFDKKCQWTHTAEVGITYVPGNPADFNFVNNYNEISTEVDVLKVEKGKETTTQLSEAVFELRKLEDVAPTNPGGTLTYVEDNNHGVIVTSKKTGANGRLTFSDLTYGVFEIREATPPPGYIQAEDVIFYLRVNGDGVTYVQKGSNKPSEWTAAPNNDETATVFFMEKQSGTNDTFRVGNTPGAALPSTGGPGTWYFILLGGLLAVFAVLLLRNRRMKPRWKH